MSIISTADKRHIYSYDGMRFLFSVMIFLNHCTFLRSDGSFFEQYLHNGGFSVSFFFLLSGFGMAIGYSEKFLTVTKENYLKFILQRLKRVYPAYFLSMLSVLVFELVSKLHSEGGNVLRCIIGFGAKLVISSSMIQSWVYTKYWEIGNSVGWYISCLFFLYLITPFVFYFTQKISKRILSVKNQILLYGIIMCICYFFIFIMDFMFRKNGWEQNILYLTPLTRCPHYIIGVCGGICYRTLYHSSPRKKAVWFDTALELAALLLTVAAYLVVMLLGFQFDRRTDVISIPVLMLLLFVFSFSNGSLSAVLGNKVNRFLGGLSMYIYLFHYVLIKTIGEKFLLPLFDTSKLDLKLLCILLFAMTLLLSALYQKIECIIIEKSKKNQLECVNENSSFNSD